MSIREKSFLLTAILLPISSFSNLLAYAHFFSSHMGRRSHHYPILSMSPGIREQNEMNRVRNKKNSHRRLRLDRCCARCGLFQDKTGAQAASCRGTMQASGDQMPSSSPGMELGVLSDRNILGSPLPATGQEVLNRMIFGRQPKYPGPLTWHFHTIFRRIMPGIR